MYKIAIQTGIILALNLHLLLSQPRGTPPPWAKERGTSLLASDFTTQASLGQRRSSATCTTELQSETRPLQRTPSGHTRVAQNHHLPAGFFCPNGTGSTMQGRWAGSHSCPSSPQQAGQTLARRLKIPTTRSSFLTPRTLLYHGGDRLPYKMCSAPQQ